MLRIRNLDAGYGKLRVLKNVSLHVDPGEIVTMIGANGAGKTTLLHTIIGLLRPMHGEISFQGQPCVRTPVGPAGRRRLRARARGAAGVRAHVGGGKPAARRLRPPAARRRRAAVQEELAHQYELFPVLHERRQQLAGTLSGGEQQMLAMGRALMSRPRLVMMDEPSTGLAPLIVRDIFRIIRRLRDEGNTVLLIEQNARAALAVADRGYVLEVGKIIVQGPAADLLANSDVQRAYLGREKIA